MSVPSDPIEIKLRSSLSDGSPMSADEATWQMIEGRIVHADSRRRGMIAGAATMAMVVAIAGVIVVSNHAGSRINNAASSSTGAATTTLTGGQPIATASIGSGGAGPSQTNSLIKLKPTIVPDGYQLNGAVAQRGDTVPVVQRHPDQTQYFYDPSQPPESTPAVAISVLPQRSLDPIGEAITLPNGDARLTQTGKQSNLKMLTSDKTFVIDVKATNISAADLENIANSVEVSNTSSGPKVDASRAIPPSLKLAVNPLISQQSAPKDSWTLAYANSATPSSFIQMTAVPGTVADLTAQVLYSRLTAPEPDVVDLATLNNQKWPADTPAYLVSTSGEGVSAAYKKTTHLEMATHGLVITIWVNDGRLSAISLIESAASLTTISESEWAALVAQPGATVKNTSPGESHVLAQGKRGSISYEILGSNTPGSDTLCASVNITNPAHGGPIGASFLCSPASMGKSESVTEVQSIPIEDVGLLVFGFAHPTVVTITVVTDTGASIDIKLSNDLVPNTNVKAFSYLLSVDAHWADVSAVSTDGTRSTDHKHSGLGYYFPLSTSAAQFRTGKITKVASGSANGNDWVLGYAPVKLIDGSSMDCFRLDVAGISNWDNCNTIEIANADPLAYSYTSMSNDGSGYIVGFAADWVQRVDIRDGSGRVVASTKIDKSRPTHAFALAVSNSPTFELHAIDANGVDSGPMWIRLAEVASGPPTTTAGAEQKAVTTTTS